MFRKSLTLFTLLIPGLASADTLKLTNITATDFDMIVKEFSANSQFTSVSPASSLGETWGFEFGVVAGVTRVPDLNGIIRRADPTIQEFNYAPHAAGLGVLTVPYGITAEVGAVPKVDKDDVSYQQLGGALKWTITDVFFTDFPVHLAPRFHFNRTQINFRQTISSVPVDVELADKVWGANLTASKKFWIFEPYAGAGFVEGNGDITATGSVNIFNTAFTSQQSASAKHSSVQLFGGLNIQMLFFVLGAEYNRAFGKNSYNGKVSFRF